MTRQRGAVRDSIIGFLKAIDREASLEEINDAVKLSLGEVSPSSVRSYLNLNVPNVFKRTSRGKYGLKQSPSTKIHQVSLGPSIVSGKATLHHADCFAWLANAESNSIHAVVTDPPYGVLEYSEKELEKLRRGKGGVWRVPPSFDGHQRAPLPRFTVLNEEDRAQLYAYFRRLGQLIGRVIVPGGNVVIASNPLLSHLVAGAMVDAGLEQRGYLARLTMTMRGGDRPKNAHREFEGVSVMPRSQWEPWVVLRRPPEGRVQDNLRRWKTGGFRRPSADKPFGDVIKSSPTTKVERSIAPHPSLKPQNFLRQLVRASLPLGEGIVLDPFAGSGSTLAAANVVGYRSIGLESDPKFFRMAGGAIPKLGSLR
jgi:site-specific DNA-methyltransferase (adenine-specific)